MKDGAKKLLIDIIYAVELNNSWSNVVTTAEFIFNSSNDFIL